MPTQAINLNFSYSNFQTFTRIRSQFDRINQLTPYDNLDTLNYTQISQSANFNGSYRFGMINKKTWSTYLSYNKSDDKQLAENTLSVFYNANTSLNYQLPSRWGFTGSMNITYNNMGTVSSTTLGPVVGINRDFLDKKLRASTSFSYNNSFTNSLISAKIYNIRFTCNYRILNKHTLTASLVFLNRVAVNQSRSFKEFTSNIGYSYYF